MTLRDKMNSHFLHRKQPMALSIQRLEDAVDLRDVLGRQLRGNVQQNCSPEGGTVGVVGQRSNLGFGQCVNVSIGSETETKGLINIRSMRKRG